MITISARFGRTLCFGETAGSTILNANSLLPFANISFGSSLSSKRPMDSCRVTSVVLANSDCKYLT